MLEQEEAQEVEPELVEVSKQPNGIADIDKLLNARVITLTK